MTTIFLTRAIAASLANVTYNAVENWIRRGKLDAINMPVKRVRVTLRAFDVIPGRPLPENLEDRFRVTEDYVTEALVVKLEDLAKLRGWSDYIVEEIIERSGLPNDGNEHVWAVDRYCPPGWGA